MMIVYIVLASLMVLTTVIGLSLDSLRDSLKKSELVRNDSMLYIKNYDVVYAAYTSYFENRYTSIIGDENVIVYLMNVEDSGFGNLMGCYFEAVSCASKVGAHFIGIWVKEPGDYYKEMPTIIRHDNPKTKNESQAEHFFYVNCEVYFPWQRYKEVNYPQIVDKLLGPSINKYISSTFADYSNLSALQIPISRPDVNEISLKLPKHEISKKHEIAKYIEKLPDINERLSVNPISESEGKSEITLAISTIPFIPDALIHFRCDDVMKQTRDSIYGFTNFNVYLLIIPENVNYIHITTFENNDAAKSHDPTVQSCREVVAALIIFLSFHYPHTVITVLRNSHVFDTITMISKSPLVVCSASTFCYFPSLMNKNPVYIPVTFLLNGGRPYFMRDGWFWMTYPKMHQFGEHFDSEFGHVKIDPRNNTRREIIINSLIHLKPKH